VVLALLGLNALVVRTTASGTTSKEGLPAQPAGSPEQQVQALVDEWVGYFNNESVSGLVSLYTAQPTISWGGNVGILKGNYSGRDVRLRYSAMFENTTLLLAIPSPINTSSSAPSTVNATFELTLTAQKGNGGTWQFIINVDQEWVEQNATWVIQREIWTNNEYSFDVQTTSSTYVPTLGPQWTIEPVKPDEPSYPGEPPSPLGVMSNSCVTDSDFLYCIAGNFPYGFYREDFYAQLGLDGAVGPWINTTAYPIPDWYPSCGSYPADLTAYQTNEAKPTYQSEPADILCIGGSGSLADGGGSHVNNQTFFAELQPNGGIGPWKAENPYPTPVSSASCVADHNNNFTDAGSAYSYGYVYCVGGTSSTAVYYAPLTPEPGQWQGTNPFPIAESGQSCVDSQHYVFCVGGSKNPTGVYFAQLSPDGGIIGGWKTTASYPVPVDGSSCVLTSGYADDIFCLGGYENQQPYSPSPVYYARLSHTGGGIEGSWMSATPYPGSGSCVEALNSIWCDWGGSIAHDVILGSDIPTVTQTQTYAAAIVTVTTTTTVPSYLTTQTINTTSTSTIFSTSTKSLGLGAAQIPASFGYALAGAAAILAVTSLVLFTKRRRTA